MMDNMEVAQVEFLCKAMNVLPQNNEATHILKCHLTSTCRSLHSKCEVHLPAIYRRKTDICQYCSNIWKNGKFTSKILPEKVPPKSIREILFRYNRNPSDLRKFEKGLAKKYAKKKNTLVIKCGICCKETKIDMIKPENVKPIIDELAKEPQLVQKKKKKKGVKDRTAGLIIPAELITPPIKKQKRDVGSGSEQMNSEYSTGKKTASVNSNKSANFGSSGGIKVNSNKRNMQEEEDNTPLRSNKKRYKRRIEFKTDGSNQNNELHKLVKNNKLGNMISNSGNASESPLSRFLSSLYPISIMYVHFFRVDKPLDSQLWRKN